MKKRPTRCWRARTARFASIRWSTGALLPLPGLVFGLDKGGQCEGIVFRVPRQRALSTRVYLHRRENITNTYHATKRPVKLLSRNGQTVNALCFFVDRRHPQYAGRIPPGGAGLARAA